MHLDDLYTSELLYQQQEHTIITAAEQRRMFYHPIEFLGEFWRITRINNDEATHVRHHTQPHDLGLV